MGNLAFLGDAVIDYTRLIMSSKNFPIPVIHNDEI